jgi:amino acid transporter
VCRSRARCSIDLIRTPDDSAAHISEEISGAQRAAPIAILVGVFGTQVLGWLLYIACSFATVSVVDLLTGSLPLPMGQLFLDVLGKRGMLAIWSFIIVVQVCFRFFLHPFPRE